MSNEPPATLAAAIKQNIKSIAQLEQQFHKHRTLVDRMGAAVSAFAGSWRFVVAHALLFGFWILANLELPAEKRFDASFTILQVWTALEVLFLSAFVVMSQNRQVRFIEHWSHVTLQIGLLTEQEITKLLELHQKLSDSLGLRQVAADPHLAQLAQPTDVGELVAELGKARALVEEMSNEEASGK